MAFLVMWPGLKNKYSEGYGERRGIQSDEVLSGLGGKRPLWMHGVSVGEVQALMPIVKAARDNGYGGPVILSTTTETGKAMALRLGGGLFDAHIYYPWDKRKFVRSALDGLRPWGFAAAETELWPNMLWEARDTGVKTFLVNGRISDRAWARFGNRLGRIAGAELYGLFDELFLRGQQDANRLRSLGIPCEKLHVVGDSKIDALLLRKERTERRVWQATLGSGGPVFIAGSTHPGEEEAVLSAFKILRRKSPDLRLIIAPRHPERAAAVQELSAGSFNTRLLSDVNGRGGWDVVVVDRIGVLFELYSVASAAFIGGSLVDKGGQNILEPASWGIPIQYGPHMEDFADASAEFLSRGIAAVVYGADDLADAWSRVADGISGGVNDRYRELCAEYFSKASGASFATWGVIGAYWRTWAQN